MHLTDGPCIDDKPLRPGKALDVLRAGSIFYQNQKVIFDPFAIGKAAFALDGDSDGVILSCVIKLGKHELALENTKIFGDFLLLDKGILHLLDHDLPDEWFEKLQKGPVLLEKDEYAAFYATYGDASMPKPHEKKVLELCDYHGTEWRRISGPKEELGDMRCSINAVFKKLQELQAQGWTIIKNDQPVVLQTGIETKIITDHAFAMLDGTLQFGDFEAPIERGLGSNLFIELEGSIGLCDPEILAAELPDKLKVPKVQIGAFESPNRPPSTLAMHLAPFKEVLPGPKFAGKLHSYQQEGLNWLSFWSRSHLGGILADEMGLGKTVQVLAFFSQLTSSHPSLIVVPTSLLFQWKSEFETFLPGETLHLYYGPNRVLDGTSRFILTSYGCLRTSAELLEQTYACVVLDEAQAIKNPRSQTFKAAVKLKSEVRISMTGTPVENKAEELQTQLKFTTPGADRPGPFLLRRTKAEVAKDLPPKITQDVFVTLEDEELAFYKEFESKLRAGLIEKENATQMEILEGILRLRQLACHPLLINKPMPHCSKLNRLLADAEEITAAGYKVVIFSQFTSMLDIIGQHLDCPYLRLDGKTKSRASLVEQFQTDPGVSVMLISLKAGGVGLNLTAADYVLLYDPWWNEAVENQAIDRAHRIGRKGAVIAKRYYAAETIEQRVRDLKIKKAHLADQLLQPNHDDLKDLL